MPIRMDAGTGGAIATSISWRKRRRKSRPSGPWPSASPRSLEGTACSRRPRCRSRLYRLAKRLNVGRILRYGDLWARYLWRRGLSALDAARSPPAGGDAAALGAALAAADMAAAKRMAVASWFPLDLANARLHRGMLASLIDARPDLGRDAGDPRLPLPPEARRRSLGRRRCPGRTRRSARRP